MNQGKQRATDLVSTGKDWTEALPLGYTVRLRIESHEAREYILPSGKRKFCTPLQWYLGGGTVSEARQSALLLLNEKGEEVFGAFRRVVV